MPGPLIAKPELPAWADPKGASVFDVPGQGVLRKLVGLLGLDDPNQVMALGGAMEVGPNAGGLIDAIAQRFPRTAAVIKAFHGSPHDFAPEPGYPLGRFDNSKIGTGEGAQAYGHGAYLAEREGTAQEYRDALAAGEYRLSTGEAYNPNDIKHFAAATLKEHPSAGDAIRSLRQQMAEDAKVNASWRQDSMRQKQAVIDAIKQGQLPELVHQSSGKMYEVAIHADPDHFLDWDKPLSQQTPHVQRALEAAGVPNVQTATAPGGQMYRYLGQDAWKTGTATPEAASELLRSRGIAGIKYLDQGSRAAGSGSRNYVVFDDKTLDILRKYGILPPIAGAALAGQKSQQGQQ